MAAEAASSQPLIDRTKPAKKRAGGGVKLSTDPQSVAARERRHRISNRFKILQSLVPGGTKMDTVSMLEEAIQYVKFLKTQIWLHQAMMHNTTSSTNASSSSSSSSSSFHQQHLLHDAASLPPLPPSYEYTQGDQNALFPCVYAFQDY